MRPLRLGAVAVLVVAIVVLLAADVRAWPAALERGDAAYAIARAAGRWSRRHLGDFAENLLGVSTTSPRCGSPARPVATYQHLNDALEVQTGREVAINALAGPASAADPRLAAQARTLLGILTFSEASNGGGISQTAIADFTDAIRVDPGDSAAKFDRCRTACRRGTGPVSGTAHRSCRLIGWGARQRLLMMVTTAPGRAPPRWRHCCSAPPSTCCRSGCGNGSWWTRRGGGWAAAKVAVAALAVMLLGPAAAQPVLDRPDCRADARSDVAVLFVLDTSPHGRWPLRRSRPLPTRLARAKRAALRPRAAIPDVPAVAWPRSLIRVLPDLLPVPDGRRASTRSSSVGLRLKIRHRLRRATNATSYAALDDIAAGNYFTKRTTRRVIVLLTDGESNPFDFGSPRSQAPARRPVLPLPRDPASWNQNEAVFDPDQRTARAQQLPTPIRPDVLLAQLPASALGGRSFEESQSNGAASYLREGRGPRAYFARATAAPASGRWSPYIAGLAILLLLISVVPAGVVRRCRLAARRRRQAE